MGGTFVSVNGSGGKRSFEVAELEVGERAEIGVEMRAPEKAGKYMFVSFPPSSFPPPHAYTIQILTMVWW